MNKRRFQPGDRVRVVEGSYRGAIATVLSEALNARLCPQCGQPLTFYRGETYYVVDLPARARFHSGACDSLAPERCIVPYYDGDEKASWSDCVWQPTKKIV